MARTPWSHSRQRTKSGNDKTATGGHEWFSRPGAEPSRKALKDMVRAHNRQESEGSTSASSRGRSRASTSASQPSPDFQRRHTGLESSGAVRLPPPSAPVSPVRTREASVASAFDRPESSAKAFLTRSGQLIKRRGSKMSLSSQFSIPGTGPPSTSRSSSSRGYICPTSPGSLTGDDLRKAISSPFDFQHVTHTDQAHFPALDRINERELRSHFTAVTQDQVVAPMIRGIHTTDFQTFRDAPVQERDRPSSPTTTSRNNILPITPPRPQPPPKDLPSTPDRAFYQLSLDCVARMTSLPSHSPLITSPVHILTRSPTEVHPAVRLDDPDPDGRGAEANTAFDEKPLPQVPSAGAHAISTDYDSPRSAASNSSVPSSSTETTKPLSGQTGVTGHQKKSPEATIRAQHSLSPSSTRPTTTGHLWDNPIFEHGEPSFDAARARAAAKHSSADALSLDRRISMGMKAIDTMEWEDAVDEAWDFDEVYEDGWDDANMRPPPLCCQSRDTSPVTPITSPDSRNRTLSTPTRNMQSPGHYSRPQSVQGSYTPAHTDSSSDELARTSPCSLRRGSTGLGIAFTPLSSRPDIPRTDSVTLELRPSPLPRFSDGHLSKSSSQESIILSIASSILSTQRSSHSSASFTDFAHLARHDDFAQLKDEPSSHSPSVGHPSPLPQQEERKAARPESTCLPPDALQVTPPIGETETDTASFEADAVSPLPTTQHRHAISAPKLYVSEGRPTSAGGGTPTNGRQRANTLGAHPRTGTRASYSLFPTPPSLRRPPTTP